MLTQTIIDDFENRYGVRFPYPHEFDAIVVESNNRKPIAELAMKQRQNDSVVKIVCIDGVYQDVTEYKLAA